MGDLANITNETLDTTRKVLIDDNFSQNFDVWFMRYSYMCNALELEYIIYEIYTTWSEAHKETV